MTGNGWAGVIRKTCRSVDGDTAVSLVATAADMMAVAENDFPDEEVTLEQIIGRAEDCGPAAGMSYQEVGERMIAYTPEA